MSLSRPVAFLCLATVTGVLGCARDPITLAERFSGLSLPEEVEIVEFHDEASGLVGEDLYVRIQLRINSSDIAQLLTQALARGYRGLPGSLPAASETRAQLELPRIIQQELRGLETASRFLYESESRSSWMLSVLNPERRTLTVERVIQ